MVKKFRDYVRANKGAIIGVAVTLMASVIAYKCGSSRTAKQIVTGLEIAGEDGITYTGRSYDGTIKTVNFRAKVIK